MNRRAHRNTVICSLHKERHPLQKGTQVTGWKLEVCLTVHLPHEIK